MKIKKKFPRYFDVFDVLVKVVPERNWVAGYKSKGKPFPLVKALSEGRVE